jgi:HEAT repeat protein
MVVLALLAALGAALPQENAASEVKRLIESLSSDSVNERDSASRRLREIGPKAIDALEKAALDRDPELRARSKRLLGLIKTRQALSPTLLRTLPGLDERLALGTDEEWTAAFLDASSMYVGRASHPSLSRADLVPLLERACQGARGSREKTDMCLAIANWHVASRSAFVANLIGDTDPRVRAAAVKAIGRLGEQSRATSLIRLLSDPDESVQTETYWALAALGSKDTAAPLRALLEADNAELRRKAASLLGGLPDRESIPRLARLLSDKAPLVRANAALALAELQVKEEVPAIAGLLRDSHPQVRGLAVLALQTLNARHMLPRISDCLADAEGTVRFYTVRCLGSWAVTEKSDRVAFLVKDPEPIVRWAALKTLACLRAKEHRKSIISALADPDDSVRMSAIHATGRIDGKAASPLIRPLLKDTEPVVRASAAIELLVLGDREGVPLLLEQEGDLHGLNSLRQPVEWTSVTRPLDGVISGTRLEVLESLGGKTGLRLDLSRLTPSDRDTWLSDPMRIALGDPMEFESAAAALGRVLWTNADWILDQGSLKILPIDEAKTFWREWWQIKDKK